MTRLMTAYERIWAVVERIPRGKVATYGQVARLAGLAGHARQVGYALFSLPDAFRLPWQRVINSKGEVSPRSRPGADARQRVLLEREGVRFDARGRVNLERHLWNGKRQQESGVRKAPARLR